MCNYERSVSPQPGTPEVISESNLWVALAFIYYVFKPVQNNLESYVFYNAKIIDSETNSGFTEYDMESSFRFLF